MCELDVIRIHPINIVWRVFADVSATGGCNSSRYTNKAADVEAKVEETF